MNYRFENAVVLTVNAQDEIIEEGCVIVESGTMTYVGPQASMPATKAPDRIIDCKGKALMPGFINTHTHLAMTYFRGYGNDLPLQQWLQEKIWPMEDRLKTGDCLWGAKLGIAEMLKSGTTTFQDMYFFMEEAAQAVEQSGIRACLTRGLINHAGFDAALAENVTLYRNWHGAADGRITVAMGPHAEYTNNDESLKKIMAAADKLQCGMHIHISETQQETLDCITRHGVTPTRYAKKLGLLDFPTVAAHCVTVTEEDMDILAEKNVTVAHNPTSNMKLGSGCAPVAQMMRSGIQVSLGTDGCSSNNNLDMWEEMTLAALIAKGFSRDPTAVTAREAVRMATIQGAIALGLDQETGSIEQGKRADLILIDLSDTRYMPRDNGIVNHIVYSGSSRDVVMTMVNGTILMEDGNLTTLNMEEIHSRFAQCAHRIYSNGV